VIPQSYTVDQDIDAESLPRVRERRLPVYER